MWIKYQPNPCGRSVGDCAIRAIAKALKVDWETAYLKLCKVGYEMCDLPNADATWGAVLRQEGFYRYSVPNKCPDCYTIKDFCIDHPVGTFVVGTGGHVVTIVNGDYYDSWESGNEIPIYYWKAP